jgi:two-component system, sensor histidine kinase RegB
MIALGFIRGNYGRALRKVQRNMLTSDLGLLSRDTRSEWVRLRTLILLRWVAVIGQLTAINVAGFWFGLKLPFFWCYAAVGAAVIANILSVVLFPENKRLQETEAVLTLLFDLAQLSFLIFLTGGLTNPFALLILAPVTISASALQLRSTLTLGSIAILLVTVTAFFHVPLVLANGVILQVPGLFAFGFWTSIVVGILFLGIYSRRIALEIRAMSDALLATQMALAREQKLTDLGGVVAAAAHELGTPLATIKLVSAELMAELKGQPDLLEDAKLIRDQADRCRDILRNMGRAGKDDLHLRQGPLGSVLKEAAEPHIARGKTVHFGLQPGPGAPDRQPTVLRAPEIIHGLRNLIQNAVDFAHGQVWIDAEWTPQHVTVRIADDGEGYAPQLLGRIGEPFVRARRAEDEPEERPEYEGMGLGLFIAKTLLERSGAALMFANGSDPFLDSEQRPERSGAVVEVAWPIRRIVAPADLATGENQRFTA